MNRRVFGCGDHRPRGFVLIGVVMIVLALTILGLSLFSLSTYEAQFIRRSMDRQQALQAALGGLDRAKYALTVKNRTLDQVKTGLPVGDAATTGLVFYTNAAQLQGAVTDSASLVDWSGNDVHIQVGARYAGIPRWAEGWYVPHEMVNAYRRLLTISANVFGAVTINHIGGPTPKLRVNVALTDSVWLAGNDLSWLIYTVIAPPLLTNQPVPVPASASFIAAHSASPSYTASNSDYVLHAPANGQLAYFYTDNPASTFSYHDFEDPSAPGDHVIHVRGRAVWCFPRGVRFEDGVTIVGDLDPDACLVIVAGDGHDTSVPPEPGAIWFFGGLVSQIPLILVSNGHVKIENFNHEDKTTQCDNLSVFASSLLLMGPTVASGAQMALSYHDAVMSAQLDFLMQFGALPNSVAPRQLTLRPGTWRVSQ